MCQSQCKDIEKLLVNSNISSYIEKGIEAMDHMVAGCAFAFLGF